MSLQGNDSARLYAYHYVTAVDNSGKEIQIINPSQVGGGKEGGEEGGGGGGGRDRGKGGRGGRDRGRRRREG